MYVLFQFSLIHDFYHYIIVCRYIIWINYNEQLKINKYASKYGFAPSIYTKSVFFLLITKLAEISEIKTSKRTNFAY